MQSPEVLCFFDALSEKACTVCCCSTAECVCNYFFSSLLLPDPVYCNGCCVLTLCVALRAIPGMQLQVHLHPRCIQSPMVVCAHVRWFHDQSCGNAHALVSLLHASDVVTLK